MKKICVLLMLGFLAALGIAGWFGYQSYTTGFSAKAEPNELEVLIARQVRHLAIPYENRRLRNPLPLTQELLKNARAHFADHCASCHAKWHWAHGKLDWSAARSRASDASASGLWATRSSARSSRP